MGRLIVAALADTHGGHCLGLCNPETVLVREDKHGNFEEYRPELTATQAYLWPLYLKHVKKTIKFASGDALVVIHDGDITQGIKYPGGLMPIAPSDQEIVARYNLLPWLEYDHLVAMRLFHGTPSHVKLGGDTSSETNVAAALRRECKALDVASYYHQRLKVGGVLFDVAHHGPSGGLRAWLRGNVARYYLQDRCWRDMQAGKPPARVYLRGHFHLWVRETISIRVEGQDCAADLVVLPSYSGLTDHARQVTRSEPELTNGLCLFEIVDGELAQVKPIKTTLDLRMEECLD